MKEIRLERSSKPKKVMVNIRLTEEEFLLLNLLAEKFANGNKTELIRKMMRNTKG